MKRLIKKILDLPIQIFLSISLGFLLIYASATQGQFNYQLGFSVVILSILVGSYLYSGSDVIKVVISTIAVLYLTSLYTSIVMSASSMIAQPFFLTIASITGFLAMTYDSKYFNFNLRSRSLWAAILSLTLFIIKGTMILSGIAFWTAEATGLITTIIFTVLWRYWTINAKKTKVVEPVILEIKDDDRFRKIYINNTLDVNEQEWTRGIFYETENSYPYIYSEALRASEEGKLLIIISKLVSSNIYDLGKIELNKAKTIPYLYMEDKNGIYSKDMIERFMNDIDGRV